MCAKGSGVLNAVLAAGVIVSVYLCLYAEPYPLFQTQADLIQQAEEIGVPLHMELIK